MNKTTETQMNNFTGLSTTKLMRWAGLAAIVSGILYIIIQPLHPSDTLSQVTTLRWSIVHILTLFMDIFALVALAGIYIRQAHKAGLLGFISYILFSLFYVLGIAFHFTEAFIFPALVTESPKFVEGLQGLVTGASSQVDLGAIPTVYAITGVSYLLGGALFGITIYRAKVLPRKAGALLTLGAVATLLGAVIPHPFDRIMAIPVGIAFIWLGLAIHASSKNQYKQ